MQGPKRILSTALAACLVFTFAWGCEKKKADPPEEPVPPTYPAVTPDELIAKEGGTGGGPNMGAVTIALFDEEDSSRVAGADVILRHGGTLVSTTQTDAQGVAAFPAVTPGSYSFTAVKTNFVNLTMVDVNSAVVALPLSRRAVGIAGNVTNVQIAGTELQMDFLAKSYDEFEQKASNRYGGVVELSAGGTGTSWSYDIRLVAGVTDTLFVSEISKATGKTINRLTRVLGPYAADQTLNLSLPTPAATGLHWVEIAATGVRSTATRLEAWYEENYFRYRSYRADDKGSGNWSIFLQMPPGITDAPITIDTYTSTNPADGPTESFRFNYTSGAADKITADTYTVAVDMVSLSGDFLSSTADLYLVDLRYNGKSHLSLGFPNPTGIDYLVRIPRNTPVDVRVVGLEDPSSGSLGHMAWHLRETAGPYAGDTTHNFTCTTTGNLALTMPIPGNIAEPASVSILSGTYVDGSFLGLPFMANGQTGTSDITIQAGYQHLSGMTFVLVVNVTERAVPEEQSLCIRGGLSNIPSQIGASLAVGLLDVPRLLSPVESASVARDSLFLLWTSDPDAASEGFVNLKLYESDDDLVWDIIARGSTLQAQLHRLPTLLSALDLSAGEDYHATIETTRFPGLAFDDFTLDSFPDEVSEMLAMTSTLNIAKGLGNTFRIQ